MEYVGKFGLLDEAGRPFSGDIEKVLRGLIPKLQRQFPAIKDEVLIVEILEEAGRKLADHERRSGSVEKLHAYAWVTVRNVVMSRMRRGAMRIARATLESEESEVALGGLRSNVGTPEQIETDILIRELFEHMSQEEQLICIWKQNGLSSREIAREQGTSVERVNTFFHRLKRKARELLRTSGAEVPSSATAPRARTRTA